MRKRQSGFSASARAVRDAVAQLKPRRSVGTKEHPIKYKDDGTAWSPRSNSDIEPLRNEEQEGYGMFDLKLGLRQRLFGVGDKDNKALTTLAVAERVTPLEAKLMFAWLYGYKNNDTLCYMASSLYHQTHWPTDTGRLGPTVGLNICLSILLRHWWLRNGRDKDYDPSRRPMSPTMMSGILNLPVSVGKGPTMFHKFQRTQIFPVLDQWETMADNFIYQELLGKGFFGEQA